VSAQARSVVSGLALAAVVIVLAQRAVTRVNPPGRVDPARWVLQDFRDAIYYPVVAFLEGRNPYDQDALARTYPVGQPFPPYLPVTLLVHQPFGLLPQAESGGVFFLCTIALTGAVAALAIGGAGVPVTAAGVLGLTALLLLSRPGNMNLALGQVTARLRGHGPHPQPLRRRSGERAHRTGPARRAGDGARCISRSGGQSGGQGSTSGSCGGPWAGDWAGRPTHRIVHARLSWRAPECRRGAFARLRVREG
jgi:hypothetical protein